jgi:hypothetical protein
MHDSTEFDLAKLLGAIEPEAFFRDSWERQPLVVPRNDPNYYHVGAPVQFQYGPSGVSELLVRPVCVPRPGAVLRGKRVPNPDGEVAGS